MSDFTWSVISVGIVCALAIVVWRVDEYRERKRKKRAPVIVFPYFSDEEKEGMYWL